MKIRAAIVLGIFLGGSPAFAHRLDEYLQAIIVSIGERDMRASMRLIPGVAVSGTVINAIDSNGDGAFSEAEQQTYARGVLRDLALNANGHKLTLRLEAVSFPSPAEMKDGTGEIHIEFDARLPAESFHRALVIENHHATGISVYLMNCLVPQDRNTRVIAQSRNANQSYYRVEYAQAGGEADSFLSRWRAGILSALAPFAGVPGMFRLGMTHIAEGTDHLLFLIALLLPAPLVAGKSRWGAFGGGRYSLRQILRVVTAFTVGHSITLALGASGLASMPERPVEVLIAFSILVSAVHAARPLFPGREPMVAGVFGLIHGMAFATTLHNLGVGPWQRLASILGFNLGIEAMQLIVVAAVLPSLLILSRMAAYAVVRCVGALFAGLASLAWIGERLFGMHTSVDMVVNGVAHRGVWIAASLIVVSMVSWLHEHARASRGMAPIKG
jgi:hypothetical protein